MKKAKISALAIVCVRNEAIHIRRCLRDLIASGLEVHLIDNGSTDGTREAAVEFLGHGLSAIDDLPWSGAFSLSQQLAAKASIVADAKADWIVHADADEWLTPSTEGSSLLESLQDAHYEGYTCVNFNEATFIPLPGEDFETEDYASRMKNYYFFQPTYPRLNRAWRRIANLDLSRRGGHILSGEDLRLSPRDLNLRHYIALSEAHAGRKYLGRRFSQDDLDKGWHGNRLLITAENLTVKPRPEIKTMSHAYSRDLDFTDPVGTHFWQW